MTNVQERQAAFCLPSLLSLHQNVPSPPHEATTKQDDCKAYLSPATHAVGDTSYCTRRRGYLNKCFPSFPSSDHTCQVYDTDREAFFNFHLVSKACRNESQYLFFRTFTIHDRTLLGPSLSSPMLERLSDRNGKTGEYVRHLKIGPFKDEDKFKLEILPLLETILRSVSNLQDLTWRVNCELPPALLNLFCQLHPSAHLHWILKNRRFHPLDHSLLSSPQLYTLDAEIYATMPEQAGHSLSELEYIKNTVPTGLQVLRLNTIDVDGSVQRAQFEKWELLKTCYIKMML